MIQVQILELLEDPQLRLKLSIVFITHDLRVAARLSDRIAVMHSGHVVEQAGTATLLAHPQHAYTQTLLRSFSRTGPASKVTPQNLESKEVCPTHG